MAFPLAPTDPPPAHDPGHLRRAPPGDPPPRDEAGATGLAVPTLDVLLLGVPRAVPPGGTRPVIRPAGEREAMDRHVLRIVGDPGRLPLCRLVAPVRTRAYQPPRHPDP